MEDHHATTQEKLAQMLRDGVINEAEHAQLEASLNQAEENEVPPTDPAEAPANALPPLVASSDGAAAIPPLLANSDMTPPTPKLMEDHLTKAPWQIWVVIAILTLEGLQNLVAIPDNLMAARWLLMKVLLIIGLLRAWRPVFCLSLYLSTTHTLYFITAAPITGLINFTMLLLVASAFRFYFPKKDSPTI